MAANINLKKSMKQSIGNLSIFQKDKKKQEANFYDSLIPSAKCNDNCLRLRHVPTWMISSTIYEHLIRKCYHPNRQCVMSKSNYGLTQDALRKKQSFRVAKRLVPALASTIAGVEDMTRNQMKLSILNPQTIMKLIDAVPAITHVPTKFRPERKIVPIKDLLCDKMLNAPKYCLDCTTKSESLSNYLDRLMKYNLRRRPPEFVERLFKDRPGIKSGNRYRALLREILTYDANPFSSSSLNLQDMANQKSMFKNPFLEKANLDPLKISYRKNSLKTS